MTKPCALCNKGGIITLLDATGTKVSGVSYTQEQAQDQGWTVTWEVQLSCSASPIMMPSGPRRKQSR